MCFYYRTATIALNCQPLRFMPRKALYDEREHGRLSAEAGGSLLYTRQPAPAEYMLSEAHRQVHRGIKSKDWQISCLSIRSI